MTHPKTLEFRWHVFLKENFAQYLNVRFIRTFATIFYNRFQNIG